MARATKRIVWLGCWTLGITGTVGLMAGVPMPPTNQIKTSTPPVKPEEPVPPMATAAAIEAAVARLGDEQFLVRERATEFLWEAGYAARPALIAATKSTDFEVVYRAECILDRFRRGIHSRIPKEIRDLMESYSRAGTAGQPMYLQRMLDKGEVAYSSIIALASAEGNIAKSPVFSPFLQLLRERAQRDLSSGDFSRAEKYLELQAAIGGAVSNADYVAYVVTRGLVQKVLPRWTEKALSGDGRAAETVAMLSRAQGDLKGAVEILRSSKNSERVRDIAMDARDWTTLERLTRELPDTTDNLRFEKLVLLLCCQQHLGQSQAVGKTIDELVKLAKGKPESIVKQTARVLCLHGHVRAALNLLGDQPATVYLALELLNARESYQEALQLAQTTLAAAPTPTMEQPEAIYYLFARVEQARALAMIGEEEKARQLFTAILEGILEDRQRNLHGNVPRVLFALRRTPMREFTNEWTARALDHPKATVFGPQVFARLFPDRQGDASLWHGVLKRAFPKEPRRVYEKLSEIFQGSISARNLAELEAIAHAHAHGPFESARCRLAIATTLTKARRYTDAQPLVQTAVRVDPRAETYLMQAGIALALRDWSLTQDASQRVLAIGPSPMATYFRGYALVQQGKTAEGNALILQARLQPLANANERAPLIEQLRRFGLEAEARTEEENLIRMGDFSARSSRQTLQDLAIADYAAGNFTRATQRRERFLMEFFRSRVYFVEEAAYLTVPAWICRTRVRELLEQGKWNQAPAWLKRGEELLPYDLDRVFTLVSALDQRGDKRNAEELFQREFARHQARCVQLPHSAHVHNQAAWLAVKSGRQLDLALAFAQRAVALAPRYSDYHNTLAEVFFARGDRGAALAAIRQALALEPNHEYFSKQLARFEKMPLPKP